MSLCFKKEKTFNSLTTKSTATYLWCLPWPGNVWRTGRVRSCPGREAAGGGSGWLPCRPGRFRGRCGGCCQGNPPCCPGSPLWYLPVDPWARTWERNQSFSVACVRVCVCVFVCSHLSMRAILVSASSRKSSSGDSTMPLGMYKESRRTFTSPVWGLKVSRRPRLFSSITCSRGTEAFLSLFGILYM